MSRQELAFLSGFGKAALLAQQVKAYPQATPPEEYA